MRLSIKKKRKKILSYARIRMCCSLSFNDHGEDYYLRLSVCVCVCVESLLLHNMCTKTCCSVNGDVSFKGDEITALVCVSVAAVLCCLHTTTTTAEPYASTVSGRGISGSRVFGHCARAIKPESHCGMENERSDLSLSLSLSNTLDMFCWTSIFYMHSSVCPLTSMCATCQMKT